MALKFANNNSLSAITSLPASVSGGALTLLSTTTASSSANLAITSGIDSTYNEYIFKFINIHPATDDVFFQFNGSDDTSSHSYNITKTTTNFTAEHNEGDSTAQLGYQTGDDLAQGTGYQRLFNGVGNDNDGSLSGELYLFNPSSTTYVTHFMARVGGHRHSSAALDSYIAGYFNTTAAITALNFQMSSGNIDSGVIKLYGVS
jgi:hypothetical protein